VCKQNIYLLKASYCNHVYRAYYTQFGALSVDNVDKICATLPLVVSEYAADFVNIRVIRLANDKFEVKAWKRIA